jgi:hypothetical protein
MAFGMFIAAVHVALPAGILTVSPSTAEVIAATTSACDTLAAFLVAARANGRQRKKSAGKIHLNEFFIFIAETEGWLRSPRG